MDLQNVKKNMEARGYGVHIFETAAEAADYLDETIRDTTVGIGGSCTVDDMGLYERLKVHNQVFWHWKDKSPDVYTNANSAKVYITSANGVAETGEIVNIDGAGNRLSAACYNKEVLYYVFGVNKLRPTLDEAIVRARTIAAPLNAQRLNRNTPCSGKPGKCYDCSSPERLCRSMSITMGKLSSVKRIEVIIINQELGY